MSVRTGNPFCCYIPETQPVPAFSLPSPAGCGFAGPLSFAVCVLPFGIICRLLSSRHRFAGLFLLPSQELLVPCRFAVCEDFAFCRQRLTVVSGQKIQFPGSLLSPVLYYSYTNPPAIFPVCCLSGALWSGYPECCKNQVTFSTRKGS